MTELAVRPRRSALYLPASNPRAIEKARTLACDVVILDLPGLERACAQGTAVGFDGKTVIPPSHLAAANAAFAPDPGAVAWARTVAAAFDTPESTGKGVLKVEGRMVERLHLAQARRLIAVAQAIAAHEA